MRSKLSLKTRIKNYLDKKGKFVNGGEIERKAMELGYKASNASRRCRELYEDKLIDRKEEKGTVWYKTLKPLSKINYYITLPDGTKQLVETRYE